jgi:hypothetical protein
LLSYNAQQENMLEQQRLEQEAAYRQMQQEKMQMEMQQVQRRQQAIQSFGSANPNLATLAELDPGKAAEVYAAGMMPRKPSNVTVNPKTGRAWGIDPTDGQFKPVDQMDLSPRYSPGGGMPQPGAPMPQGPNGQIAIPTPAMPQAPGIPQAGAPMPQPPGGQPGVPMPQELPQSGAASPNGWVTQTAAEAEAASLVRREKLEKLERDARGETTKLENELRDEFRGESQDFVKVRDAYMRILSASDSAQGQMGLIFNYMKMLDPGSTVREGEYATAEETRGIPQTIVALYNKAQSGEFLDPVQIAAFKDEAGRLYGSQRLLHDARAEQYLSMAEQNKLRPSLVVRDYTSSVDKYIENMSKNKPDSLLPDTTELPPPPGFE